MKMIPKILMVFGALLFIASACSRRDIEKSPRPDSGPEAVMIRSIEHILRKWEPDNTNYVPFIGAFHAPGMTLAGFWEKRQEMDLCKLNIQETGTGFTIEFFARGCVGTWTLKRTGRIHDGILSMNQPVMEYVPRKYDKIYPLRVDGHDYLISQASIRELHERSLLDPKSDLVAGIMRNSFERKADIFTDPKDTGDAQ